MGALATVFIIWGLIIYLCYESIIRIMKPEEWEIDAKIMLITSCIGLAFNGVNLIILKYACNEDEKDKDKEEQNKN